MAPARRDAPPDLDRGNSFAAEQLAESQRYVRPTDISEFTPAYVEAHRAELGLSPNAPTEDFFNEFIAHQMAGTDERQSDRFERCRKLGERAPQDLAEGEQDELDLWRQETGMLMAWGYEPTVDRDQEVEDTQTGLYGVRFDPTERGSEEGRRSITTFRGTKFEEGPLDLFTDCDSSVGEGQYRPNQEAIHDLVVGGTEDPTVTGQSLGGYLAARTAADCADEISQVVTFQAGGMAAEDAERFEATRGDTQVRHHTADWDLIHLGGEQRLDGQTFHHHAGRPGFDHIHGMMFGGSGPGMLQAAPNAGVDEGVEHNWDPALHHGVEMMRRGIGSPIRHGHQANQRVVDAVIGGAETGSEQFEESTHRGRQIATDWMNGRRGDPDAGADLADTVVGGVGALADTGANTASRIARAGVDGAANVAADLVAAGGQGVGLAGDALRGCADDPIGAAGTVLLPGLVPAVRGGLGALSSLFD